MKSKFVVSALAVSCLIVASAQPGTADTNTQSAAAQPDTETQGDELILLTSEEALQQDLELAASAYGLRVEELRVQWEMQDRMDTINFAALDPGYVEDGSTGPGHDFRLWYRSALEPSQKLLSALDAIGVRDLVDFQRAPYSFADLEDRVRRLNTKLDEAKSPVDASINTEIGGADLHPRRDAAVTDGDLDAASQAASSLDLATRVEILPEPMQIGGREVDPDWASNYCTGGFVARKDGSRALLSAGHCAGLLAPVTYAGNSGFNVTRRSTSATSDVLVIDKDGTTWTAQTQFGDGNQRDVTDKKGWGGVDVGDNVAKYGKTTGITLGEITDKTSCGGAGEGCTSDSRFIRVKKVDGVNMCLGGDSGGPFMVGTIALGILSAGYDNGDCTYMPTNIIADKIDWHVVTP